MRAKASPEEIEFHVQMGQRISELRKRHGITQSLLAEMVGVTEACVSNAEHGKHSAHVWTVVQIADALSTSVSYLIGTTDEP